MVSCCDQSVASQNQYANNNVVYNLSITKSGWGTYSFLIVAGYPVKKQYRIKANDLLFLFFEILLLNRPARSFAT